MKVNVLVDVPEGEKCFDTDLGIDAGACRFLSESRTVCHLYFKKLGSGLGKKDECVKATESMKLDVGKTKARPLSPYQKTKQPMENAVCHYVIILLERRYLGA
jgi:hypothetical protein